MSFIKSILESDEKYRYKKMLDTFFILLICDQAFIKEFDERGREYQSATWLYSYRTFYEAIGYGRQAYPQGSISANRLFYKALKNYYSSFAVKNKLMQLTNSGLTNFLKLRCEDSSSPLPSYMYGSTYEIVDSRGIGNKGKIRVVSERINFRHTANALSILFLNTNELNSDLLASYESMLNKVKELFKTESEESNLHVTLSSILNVLHTFINKYEHPKLKLKTEWLIEKCEERLLSENSLYQENNGYYNWNLINECFRKYDYYLTFFSFEQYPYILKKTKAQSILRNIIENNTIIYKDLPGIPLSSLNYLNMQKNVSPDFGITISLVYILQFCIENNIGDENWTSYCKKQVSPYLKFCLRYFDDQSIHQITMLESAAKTLLLPNIELNKERNETNLKKIEKIRNQIELSPESISPKLFKGNEDCRFIIDFVKRWNIKSHKEKDSKNKMFYLLYDLGSILGGYSGKFAKEFFN